MDHWVWCMKDMYNRYMPGNPMLPVVGLEQISVVESRSYGRSFN